MTVDNEDLGLIAYLMMSCEDFQRPSSCEICPVYKICLGLRFKLYGRDILKEKTYDYVR